MRLAFYIAAGSVLLLSLILFFGLVYFVATDQVMLDESGSESTRAVVAAGSSREQGNKAWIQSKPGAKSPLERASERPEDRARAFRLWMTEVMSRGVEISDEKLAEFLKARERSVDSLMAVFLHSKDSEFLDEMVEKYPDDPQVRFYQAVLGPVETRMDAINSLLKHDPDNMMGSILAATEVIRRSDDVSGALGFLFAASERDQINDYEKDAAVALKDLYVFAGQSGKQAWVAAGLTPTTRISDKTKELNNQLINAYQSSLDAGETDQANEIARTALAFAINLEESDSVVGRLEQAADLQAQLASRLLAENPDGEVRGLSLLELLSTAEDNAKHYKELPITSHNAFANMGEDEWSEYFTRILKYGDYEAMQWLVNESGWMPESP